MKFYQIEPKDARTIAPTVGLTIADLKTICNALALDMASDNAAQIETSAKAKLWAKLSALIAA